MKAGTVAGTEHWLTLKAMQQGARGLDDSFGHATLPAHFWGAPSVVCRYLPAEHAGWAL